MPELAMFIGSPSSVFLHFANLPLRVIHTEALTARAALEATTALDRGREGKVVRCLGAAMRAGEHHEVRHEVSLSVLRKCR